MIKQAFRMISSKEINKELENIFKLRKIKMLKEIEELKGKLMLVNSKLEHAEYKLLHEKYKNKHLTERLELQEEYINSLK